MSKYRPCQGYQDGPSVTVRGLVKEELGSWEPGPLNSGQGGSLWGCQREKDPLEFKEMYLYCYEKV